MAFSNSWDETQPPDTQTANLLGQDLRDLKKDIRERMRLLSGNIADRPTPDVSWATATAGVIFFALDQKKVYQWVGTPPAWVDITESVVATIPMAGIAADRPMAGTSVGQLYFAFDTGKLWYWDGVAWVDITADMGVSYVPTLVLNSDTEITFTSGKLIIKMLKFNYPLPGGSLAASGNISTTLYFASPFPVIPLIAVATPDITISCFLDNLDTGTVSVHLFNALSALTAAPQGVNVSIIAVALIP